MKWPDVNLHSRSFLVFYIQDVLTGACVEDNSGEMIETERGVDLSFWLQIVPVGGMVLVQLLQHGAIRTLQTHQLAYSGHSRNQGEEAFLQRFDKRWPLY